MYVAINFIYFGGYVKAWLVNFIGTFQNDWLFYYTRKYPLHGYFLGVLAHTTAWDQLWGGDENM